MKSLKPGYYGVQFRQALHHDFRTRLGRVDEKGVLSVGGVRAACGSMVGRILTQPFQLVGGDLWTMSPGDVAAVLADGTEVIYTGSATKFRAGGKEYISEVAAAIDLTPAI